MTQQKVELIIEPKLSIEDINARIKQEVCYETLEELTDAKLMSEYKDCNSVKNEIKKLSDVLEKYIDEETKTKNNTRIFITANTQQEQKELLEAISLIK